MQEWCSVLQDWKFQNCASPVYAIALNPKEAADGLEGQAVRQPLTEPVCMYRSIYTE